MQNYAVELQFTYNAIKNLLTSYELEDFKVAKLVHEYRMYWKPEKVKVLLLAESHVYTPISETEEKLESPGLINYPDNYVRFVYCLAYGENSLLHNRTISNNRGTPQFWKLFNESVCGKYAVVNNSDKEAKINHKIELLKEMQRKGIWLLDSSIIGIYRNANKPNNKEYKSILSKSFINYCLPIIEKESPEKIIVIGKSVFDLISENISDESDLKKYEWMHQPNARIKRDKRITISKLLSNYNQ